MQLHLWDFVVSCLNFLQLKLQNNKENEKNLLLQLGTVRTETSRIQKDSVCGRVLFPLGRRANQQQFTFYTQNLKRAAMFKECLIDIDFNLLVFEISYSAARLHVPQFCFIGETGPLSCAQTNRSALEHPSC